MTSHEDRIRAAVEATAFLRSATGYSWFGKPTDRLPLSILRSFTEQAERGYLHYSLQMQLYQDFYCPGEATPRRQSAGGQSQPLRTPFVEALSDANSGNGYWTEGWSVTATGKGMALVRKNGVQLLAGAGECEPDPSEQALNKGDVLRLQFPKEFLHLSPGFYMAHGNLELEPEEGSGLVRLYWNLTATGALGFMRQATEAINSLQVPFKLKALSDPDRYLRCDAVVLYIRKRDCAIVCEALARVYADVAVALKPLTPALTKELAPGVGLAEDPGNGTSFGLHRCGLLAEGLIRAREQGKKTLSQRMDVIEDALCAEGVDLSRPYLNPGSEDQWSDLAVRAYAFQKDECDLPRRYDKAKYIETADRIGRKLTGDALWCNDQCNWVGPEPTPQDGSHAASGAVYGSLSPDMYAGTAGLGWFLAQLYMVTGNPEQLNAAHGAITRSFAAVDSVPPVARYGFYSGWSGIAYVAAQAGSLLKEEIWLQQAHDLLTRLVDKGPFPREYDFLSGTSGAIAALLVLWKQIGDAPLLEMATRLGDALLEAAEPFGSGYCWPSAGHPENPGLTGFSHGTSGIGHALFELYHATGEREYRQFAAKAFDYENELFEPSAENWPDLRNMPEPSFKNTTSHTFGTAWCHGAPGIALARMHAFNRVNEPRYRKDANIALNTTARAVRAGLASESENYSLCHGMAGNADVLLRGCRKLGTPPSDSMNLVHHVASIGIQNYAVAETGWPCGIPWETPGLMLGLAGIGYFYLRAAEADLPCILDPFPEVVECE